MKKLVLICLLCFPFLYGGVRAVNPQLVTFINKTSTLPHGYDEIELKGDLMYSSGPDAINAGIGEDAIYIEFNQNLGNVTISLYGESGALVYNAVVNTGVQQLVIIPINNEPGVSYTLEINNAAGYAEGFIDR